MPSANSELPLVQSARREAIWVIVMWLVALVYTLSYCYLYGYHRDVATMQFVLWFPDWVFWGVIFPWCVCTLVSAWFAFFVMRDEDLGAEPPEESDPFNA